MRTFKSARDVTRRIPLFKPTTPGQRKALARVIQKRISVMKSEHFEIEEFAEALNRSIERETMRLEEVLEDLAVDGELG